MGIPALDRLRSKIQIRNIYIKRWKDAAIKKEDFFDRAKKVLEASALPCPADARLLEDMWRCFRFRRFFPEEYIAFRFYEKSAKQRRTFISEIEARRYALRYNCSPSYNILKNKAQTYAYFKRFFCRELLEVKDEKDFDAFATFANRHPTFFVKPQNGSCGRQVKRLTVPSPEQSEPIFAALLFGYPDGFVVGEEIRQHPEIAKYHPNSVNTFRVITMQRNLNVAILTVLLRIGKGDMCTDNISSGGFFCRIDPLTGRVIGIYDSRKLPIPDPAAVGAPSVGAVIPQFDSLLPFMTEVCGVLPDLHWIGWDVALTENGWCLVEGNSCCHQTSAQTGLDVGMKKILRDTYRKLRRAH